MKPIVLAVTARVDAELYLERCAGGPAKDGAAPKDKLAARLAADAKLAKGGRS